MTPYFDRYNRASDCTPDPPAETVVLIHGWGMNGSVFDTVVPELLNRFNVIVLDLPGMGRSPVYNGIYGLDYLADQVLSVIHSESSYHLVGWSLGGLVAAKIASRAADRVLSCSLVATNPCFVARPDHLWPGVNPSSFDQFLALLREDAQGCLIRFLALQCKGAQDQRALIQYLKERVFLHGLPANRALEGGMNILAEVDARDLVRHLRCPVWMSFGAKDELIPLSVRTAMETNLAEGARFRFTTYPHASHLPFVTEAECFVRDWIEAVSSMKEYPC